MEHAGEHISNVKIEQTILENDTTDALSECNDNMLMAEHGEYLCEEYVMGEEMCPPDEEKEQMNEDDEMVLNEEENLLEEHIIAGEHIIGDEHLVASEHIVDAGDAATEEHEDFGEHELYDETSEHCVVDVSMSQYLVSDPHPENNELNLNHNSPNPNWFECEQCKKGFSMYSMYVKGGEK